MPKTTKKSKGTGMPRGKATYSAVPAGNEDMDMDMYTIGRSSNEKGEYGIEPGPMVKGEKEARERASEMQRESRGFKMGGMVNVRGQGAARKTKGCKIT